MRQNIPDSLAEGRYEVGALIGHGGMAEVHLGTDTRLGRQVAIKIMRSDLANDAIFLSRFRREAHSVAMLNNPNIVSIYDTGEEPVVGSDGHQESVPYLIMEYVKGQTLRDILKENGALSQSDAEQIIIGVLNALEYSHRMGIIHRDIKPGNIMISDQGVVKVMDFGIARALDDSSATMTQSQGVVGTAQYLSPEQARGENVDMRSDLYSAGCVLYEILTGRPPFTGDSPVAIAYQHVSEVATPPSSLVPGLPKIWDSVLAKAMAKDRQNRYSTAAEFKRDVMAVMNGGQVAAAAFNPLTDLANLRQRKQEELAATQAMPAGAGATEATQAFNPIATAANAAEEPSRLAQREAQKKRKKKLIIIWSIVGAVVLAALIAGGFMLFGNHQDDEMVTVPTITSEMSETRAKEKIVAAGFKYKQESDTDSSEPKGTFTKQNPAGGKKAKKGSTVTVWFSAGPASATVPDVTGLTQSEAKEELESAGFVVGSTSSEDSANVPKDRVTRTDPAAATSQPKGTSIILYISTGQTSVPDVTGKSSTEAQETLSKQGFSITIQSQNSNSVAKGVVIKTDPVKGSTVTQGSMITVYVSNGKEQATVPQDMKSKTLDTVQALLQNAGFTNIQISGSTESTAVVTKVTANGKDVTNGGSQVDKDATIVVTTQAPATTDNSDNTGGTGSDDAGTGSSGDAGSNTDNDSSNQN
ncbi:MAG: Stk1 family PASTA domain-containing Ser/Thr kinase [Bifidobacteriaceae bacterium]|jgi:serine/threonine-protein kinase|nr:Stk1 family PASTA domain-containing Ser/Thr kinase [Bifidobacteriaceae bacterium]MCI1979199.1 Stk1 family PASTA domain-containing Ser/Thr kinase [Bifidobacteriaceae bacterium]